MNKKIKRTRFQGLVPDRLKRINLKSKRMRTLFKKAIELSKMCNIDISMQVWDQEMKKMYQYNSINAEKEEFTPEKAS